MMNVEDWLEVVTVSGLAGTGFLVAISWVGVIIAARAVKSFPLLKGKSFLWHKWGTIIGSSLILLHSLSTLTTTERTAIVWQDLLIPFYASKETLWLGLGSIAIYMMVLTIIASLTLQKNHRKLWRVLHYGTYGILGLGIVHGLFISSSFQPDWQLDLWDAEKLTVIMFGVVLIAAIVFRVRASMQKAY